ncbi:MAG: sigma 54-dependent Fis family transcriptional regulator [Labilithrix sp.]|nr:sigma 54-dependent Fis family transcriptional regulator [Labilithrix sp.]MCW5815952.1 sigma 54-dependent Fis family transcriptional regulator [Labilithrix sp.]
MSGDDPTTRGVALADIHSLLVRDARIVVVEGPDAGQSVQTQGGAVHVGSGTQCDLRLSDPLVSRRHLEVHGEPGGVRIVDRGSRNGTFFHGARVTELRVTSDVELTLGSTRLALTLGREPLKLPFSPRTTFGSAVAHSESMRHVFRVLEMAAAKDVTVLIEGESGTGKEVLASSLHAESPRRDGPFVVVDCGSIPANLVESELFGHERGAFTGAVAAHAGAFEQAHRGTIFLDEIGELPLDAQPKLLRALESRSVRRIGGRAPISFDVRVVAATNRRLKEAVRCKEFRQDLFYRLAVVHVSVPPLGDRKEDIPLLAERFLRIASGDANAVLPPALVKVLTGYDWPGNVRELRNVIDRFATFDNTDERMLFDPSGNDEPARGGFDFAALAAHPYAEAKRQLLDAYHRAVIPGVVEECGGSVQRAADRLGMSRANLYRVLSDLGAKVDDA